MEDYFVQGPCGKTHKGHYSASMNVAHHLILKKSKCLRKDLLRQVSLVRAQSWIHPSSLDGRALCSLFALSPCLILRSRAVGQLASFISSRSQVRVLPPQQMQNAVGTGCFVNVSYGGIIDGPRPFSACRFCFYKTVAVVKSYFLLS